MMRVRLASVLIVAAAVLASTARAEEASAGRSGSGPRWPDLSGRWAQLQVTTAIVDLPIAGPADSRLETVAVVDVQQDGRDLQLSETVCSIASQGPTSLVETTYPPAFSRALSGHVRSARLAYRGGRLAFVQPRSYRTNGVQLADPAAELLPHDPNDPRIRDSDADGRPGLTVEVRGFVNGQVFIAQRGWSELDGVVRSRRQIEGSVRWDSEQAVLDATHRFLTRPPISKPHPQRDRHFFRMARIPDRATCEQVVDRVSSLFGTRLASTR
jgi:hypothetical protein